MIQIIQSVYNDEHVSEFISDALHSGYEDAGELLSGWRAEAHIHVTLHSKNFSNFNMNE